MNFDPHTLQAILLKIEQQVRCPQCGKKVPVNFSAVKVVSGSTLVLQLRCEECDTHIVLQASLQNAELEDRLAKEHVSEYNASTNLELSQTELDALHSALESSGGSFTSLFGKIIEEEDKDK